MSIHQQLADAFEAAKKVHTERTGQSVGLTLKAQFWSVAEQMAAQQPRLSSYVLGTYTAPPQPSNKAVQRLRTDQRSLERNNPDQPDIVDLAGNPSVQNIINMHKRKSSEQAVKGAMLALIQRQSEPQPV